MPVALLVDNAEAYAATRTEPSSVNGKPDGPLARFFVESALAPVVGYFRRSENPALDDTDTCIRELARAIDDIYRSRQAGKLLDEEIDYCMSCTASEGLECSVQ